MILDLEQFIKGERPYWRELESLLVELENRPGRGFDLDRLRRFHYLYERAAADLGQIQTFASEPAVNRFLEGLVAKAYAEIHARQPERVGRWSWVRRWVAFPQAFRRRWRAFAVSLAATAIGALFGGLALELDPASKSVILPFPHLLGDPSDRVAWEESRNPSEEDRFVAAFSSQLMTHNIRVSVSTFALGLTWGLGTLVMLFYNGVILGAVAWDYLRAGEGVFLAGWLLPHGVIEIPAILIAGQAGLVMGGALVGWGNGQVLAQRLRSVGPDVVRLVLGLAVMLVWAGVVEAFLSQLHQPAMPYWVKITFGLVELAALVFGLGFVGTGPAPEGRQEADDREAEDRA